MDGFDAAGCIDRLAAETARAIRGLGRRGAVVATSGGIDSSVAAGICVRALGADKVQLLRLPERDVGDSSSDLALELAESLGADSIEEPITGGARRARLLRAARRGDPRRLPRLRAELEAQARPLGAIRLDHGLLAGRRAAGRDPGAAADARRRVPVAAGGDEHEAAGPQAPRVHLGRPALLRRDRERPNLLEYDQGFFVKGGDGLADVKPIAGLYKGQVYAVARELGLPEAITSRQPTTETFSLPQTQEEFYFGYSYERMDELMWGHAHDVDPAELCARVGMSAEEVGVAYAEIERRRTATAYLHAPAVLVSPEA